MSKYKYEGYGVIRDTEIDFPYHTDDIVELLDEKDQNIADLEAKLAESEEKVKHWHDLYNERDKQFQSVRQRYHLLNKLKSNYDKKDKLHLAYMQCAELVDENEQLKQQLHDLPKKIVGEIKEKLHDRLSKIAGYGRMTTDEFLFFVENEFTKDIETILKKYGVE